MPFTRRKWLSQCVAATAASGIAAAQRYAQDAVRSAAPPAFQSFDAATGAEIAALTSQIIPSDDGPGAREAGVVYFIDRALGTFDADQRQAYQRGLAAVQKKRRELFPQSSSIATLPPAGQMELIRAIEHTGFFALLRKHTVYGFLGDPSYGGNRGGVGWKWVGFENRMSYQPPFGYYDAQAKGGE